uniref:Putative methylesterase 10-like isoform X1 n=1 Tax=Davidia involucrata TaxID=16924 RepID=A0A5B7BYB1_DAVIN
MELMASLPCDDEKVILVGHSYGGLPISMAMEAFPEKISGAVFVTAYMPNHKDPPATLIQEFFRRISIESLMDCQFTFDGGPENLPTSTIFGPNYIATKLYQHCQPEDLELAKMLVRPNGFFLEDMAKESLLTEEKYGSIRRDYIMCEEDEVVKEEFA